MLRLDPAGIVTDCPITCQHGFGQIPPKLHFHPPKEGEEETLTIHFPPEDFSDIACYWNNTQLVAPAYIAPNTTLRAYVMIGDTKHEIGTMVDKWSDTPEVWFIKGGMEFFINVEGFDKSVLKPDCDPQEQDVAAVFVMADLCDDNHLGNHSK